jgi:hypothetical protein
MKTAESVERLKADARYQELAAKKKSGWRY